MDHRNVQSATAVVSNSAYTAKRIKEVYGRESTPAPPGVDLSAFHPMDGEREGYLLSVGAIHPLKGLELVVEALGRLPVDLRLPLTIVSDRHRERALRKILAFAGRVGVQVEVRSRIPEEDLSILYARARAVLCASHLEPLGLVPLEAMACGTPVLAVDEGGFQETVVNGKTGFLVPRDAGAVAEKLQWILEHPAEAETLGSNGRREVVSNWSWELSIDRLSRVIRKVIAR
jgi:glycosyltransferase involved in cell wall biosynthesis